MLGQLNKEEQVQVVIRLKPVPNEQITTRSVYVSDEQDKTLVVETPNKKEYFVFDNIADDQCSQQEIYEYIGQDAVKSSTDVCLLLCRDTTVAFSPTDKLVLAKATLSLATVRISSTTSMQNHGEFSHDSFLTCSLGVKTKQIVSG